jgi:hypothetical protein
MFLLVLVDDSCSRVSSCITTWLVRVLSVRKPRSFQINGLSASQVTVCTVDLRI